MILLMHRCCFSNRGQPWLLHFSRLRETHPQNPVEVLFIHSQELTVVLSQDNGGGAGSIVDESELPKVVSFMKSTNDTLRSTSPGLTMVWRHHWCTLNTHFSIDDYVDWAFQNNVPWCALFSLAEHWGRGAVKAIRPSVCLCEFNKANPASEWAQKSHMIGFIKLLTYCSCFGVRLKDQNSCQFSLHLRKRRRRTHYVWHRL